MPLFNTAASCWLKHFPARFCLLVWLCSRRLNACVWRGYPGPLSELRVCIQYECECLIVGEKTFWKPLQYNAGVSVVSSPFALRTNKDWSVFRSRSMATLFWLCLAVCWDAFWSMTELFFVSRAGHGLLQAEWERKAWLTERSRPQKLQLLLSLPWI